MRPEDREPFPRHPFPDHGPEPETSREGSGRLAAGPIFLAGAVLGAALAAAWGLDFWPRRPVGGTPGDRRAAAGIDGLDGVRARIQELEAALAEERARPRTDASGTAAPAPLPVADSGDLIGLLDGGEWSKLAAAVEWLLARGEAGFEVLVEAIAAVVPGRVEALSEPGALFPLIRTAARREKEVADLIPHLLVSSRLREDPAAAERILEWSAAFLAASREPHPEARAALVQSLEMRLEEGGVAIWAVLRSLETLRVEVPIASVRRLLDRRDREEDQGVVIRHLGRSGNREAVEVLAETAAASAGRPAWQAVLALEVLGAAPGQAAEEALERFLSAPEAEVREAAHLAYFARRRDPAQGHSVLLRFLNSGIAEPAGRRVLGRIRLTNPDVLAVLAGNPEGLSDPGLREEVRAIQLTLPARGGQ